MDNAGPGELRKGVGQGTTAPATGRGNLVRRGRPRRNDASIPAHIRAVDLPRGIYWDRSRKHWYTIVEEGDAKRRVKLGDPKATLLQLQSRLADIKQADTGTLDWLMAEFEKSVEFTPLAEGTKDKYRGYRIAIAAHPTKVGRLGTLFATRLERTFFQALIDKIAKAGTPTKANHWLRYLRRVYSFGMRRTTVVKENPCKGVQEAKERKEHHMPSRPVHATVLAFAKEGASRKAHTKNSVPGYVWIMMELMYLCRLRSIEAASLTDDLVLKKGLQTDRRKGSRDNIVAWTPRLRQACDAAKERRTRIWNDHGREIPIRPEHRFLLVNESGDPLTDTGIQDAWTSMMLRAIEAKVIREDQRFTTHGLKHRGVTDTPGNRHDKQQASGHKNEEMMDTYDHELPVVPTSERDDVEDAQSV